MQKVNTIMLIDDDEIDNIIHSRVLKGINLAENILVHKSAPEALTFLKDSALTLWPNLIFLDLNMPKMNGFEFLAEFIKLPGHLEAGTKIIIVSSSLNPDDKINAYKSPVVKAFIVKPLKREVILECLK